MSERTDTCGYGSLPSAHRQSEWTHTHRTHKVYIHTLNTATLRYGNHSLKVLKGALPVHAPEEAFMAHFLRLRGHEGLYGE